MLKSNPELEHPNSFLLYPLSHTTSMPSLKALNHRWLVGGDEIQAMSLFIIPARVLQSLLLFGSCLPDDTSSTSLAYMAVSAVYFLSSVILELCTLRFASMGSPTNCDPRVAVATIVKTKTLFMYPLLAANVGLGCVVVSQVRCGPTVFFRLLPPALLATQVFEVRYI